MTVKYIYLLSALFGLLLPMAVRAQNVLTAEEHALRPCDKTERLQTEFFDVGNPGNGVVWDFSTLDTSSRKTITEYLGGTDSTVVEAAPHSIRKYVLRNDSLFLCAYRNRLYDIEYSVPILEMVYPMQFGDTLYTYYSGNGLYSGKRQVETAGEARVSADAYGTLVMPSGDTLRNVVRIYTFKTSTLWMPEPDKDVSDGNRKLCVEENYKWYARGFRYPVVETVSESYYDGTAPVSCRQAVFLYLPDDQQLLNDTVNMRILQEDSLQNSKSGDAFHYDVSVNGSNVTIGYSLDTTAHVSFIVSDTGGVVYRRSGYDCEAGRKYNATIDCGGMLCGEYVLYIYAGGQVYNSKIRLK